MHLLEEAVASLGPERAGFYDLGEAFEVRVVNQTSRDTEVVTQLQGQTTIPLRLKAVRMSASWLKSTALRLDADLPKSTAHVGVDLEAGRLWAAIDEEHAPRQDPDTFAEQVRGLVASYLPDGRREGAVDDSVTADEAVDITKTETQQTDVRGQLPIKSGRWLSIDIGNGYKTCTAGFLVKGNSSGVLRFATAGHCFEGGTATNPNVYAWSSGSPVGTMTSYRPGGWDTANFSITSGSSVDPAVTVNSAGDYRIIYDSGNPVDGSQNCFAGWGIAHDSPSYDEKCGTQNRTDIYDGKQLYCLERRTFGGDSGGPVYATTESGQAAARGTTVESLKHTPFIGSTQWFNCYNRIGDIASAGNWSVVTWK